MLIFEAPTADGVWQEAVNAFRGSPDVYTQIGRNGETRELLQVGFVISDPRQRWILSRRPAINPAFAIAEVIWILSGSNNAEFLNYWNRQLPRYAGTSNTYSGAYGFRLRQHFGFDQLARAFHSLKENPNGRQVVLQIWDTKTDLPQLDGSPTHPDVPCNIMAMLKIRHSKLFWTQINRSNDMFLGVPHNFIQFTVLQEVLAGWLGVGLGNYTHISDSLHLYEKDTEHVFSSESDLDYPMNGDLLTMAKEQSDRSFLEVYEQITEWIQFDISELDLKSTVTNSTLPLALKNMLTVMALEFARRNHWTKTANALVEDCSNPVLKLAWNNWVKRYPI